MINPARELAYQILLAVEGGAFAADLLSERSKALTSRDAGLAATITLGVLRFQSQLDHVLEQFTGKPVTKLDAEIRATLRIGTFQLRHLDRVPTYAAVGESVELAKRHGKRSAAGLVNAVLRKAGDYRAIWPDRSRAFACPEWLLARWSASFGEAAAEAIASAALETPKRYARLPSGTSSPAGALATEIALCFEILPGEPVPAGSRLQDIGSQAVVPLLDLSPSHRMLDLCAAPGNKTTQSRESGAWVLAGDVSPRRLAGVAPPCVVLDARSSLPFLDTFDRILVDAPCSGTGTLAHNPELKWRLTEASLARHAERQRAILRNALAVLKPGGLLVYSTCSLEPEENEHVVAAVAPERILRTMRRLPGRDPGDGFFAAVIG